MSIEEIINRIDELAQEHIEAIDLNDAELIELEAEDLICDYCRENRYEVNGFPFKLTESNIELEEYYESIGTSINEVNEQYIDYLATEKEDVAELMWHYTKSFWPDQFESKTEYIKQLKDLLESGTKYEFEL